MGSCAAPSAKGDDKFITTDYLQQCPAASIAGLIGLCGSCRTAAFIWLLGVVMKC
ncbi:replication initiator protein (plasmid) [Escherichia coli]|nr:replication initiator protein [Escherichia coli]